MKNIGMALISHRTFNALHREFSKLGEEALRGTTMMLNFEENHKEWIEENMTLKAISAMGYDKIINIKHIGKAAITELNLLFEAYNYPLLKKTKRTKKREIRIS